VFPLPTNSMSCTTVYPAFPAIVRGQPTVLKTDPKRTKLIYGFGNLVVIREAIPSAANKKVQLYTGHSYPVTAVEMATSGCYMASGDKSGVVRIWACDNPEQILKLETPLFGGAVLDIAWSGDSQRLIGVGDGSAVYGKVIMWDSGNSVGEITGHAKKINSCSFKSSRPFRLATGGEDNKVNFFEGPPFKYKVTSKTHERFVNVVRFSPDGARFFSASSDMKIAVYDGKEGTMIVEKKVHEGSIYSAMWSPDSSKILTCSGDGTSKVLDAATLDEVGVLNFKSGDKKKAVEEQQVPRHFPVPSTLHPVPALASHYRAHPLPSSLLAFRRSAACGQPPV
jgi:WD40 repeat protein